MLTIHAFPSEKHRRSQAKNSLSLSEVFDGLIAQLVEPSISIPEAMTIIHA